MTTKIEWAAVPDGKGGFKIPRTWNPQVGCREISPACRECYAAKLAHRGMSPQHKGLTVMRTNAAGENLGVHWNGEINRVPHLLAEPLSWRKPSGVFVGSMTDLFFDVETDEACRWIAAIFGIMAATQRHTYTLLTKRPDNAARWFAWLDEQAEGFEDEAAPAKICMGAAVDALTVLAAGGGNTSANRDRIRRMRAHGELAWPLPNVWVGVTAEDQKRADERVPVLLGLPAAIRFVSYEPACSAIDFTNLPATLATANGEWEPWERFDALSGRGINPGNVRSNVGTFPRLDWLILGGESGPRARPSHPQWFRDAIAQCEAAGVAVFFKQWGEWAPLHDKHWQRAIESKSDHFDMSDWNHARGAWVGEPSEGSRMIKVGKTNAGRLLDGREHNGFPEVRHG